MGEIMKVLAVSEDDRNRIKKHYHVNEKNLREDLKILKNWIAQQRHLPQNVDENFLERCLLRNKFRLEQTKQKIEGYYTLRGIYREFFRTSNMEFVPSLEYVIVLPLPKLTPKCERIISLKFRNPDPEIYHLNHVLTFIALLFEILMRYDYSLGDRFIFDCSGSTLEHMAKFSAVELSKAVKLYQGAYSGRLAGIEIINTPPFLNLILNLLKLVLPTKLYDKIKTHNELSSLYEVVPKSCLPKEYGGDLETFDTLQRKWDKIFENKQNFFDKNYFNVSNEGLRIGENVKDDSFGIDGTFKKLSFD